MSRALQAAEGGFAEGPAGGGVSAPYPALYSPASVDLSVVVPAYNEAARLPAMLAEALGYLGARAAASPPFAFEIIVVDDGSADDTADVARGFAARHGAERVSVLRLPANAGKGAAVRRGVLAARGARVLMADADGATVFADVAKLEASVQGADVAIGSRTHLKGRGASAGRSLVRSFFSTVFNLFVMYVAGVRGLRDTQCGFKLFTRDAAVVAFAGQKLDRWAFDVENLYRVQRVGMRVVEVPVQWTEVPGSKLSVIRATINMIADMIRMRFAYAIGKWTIDPYPS